MLIGSIVSLTIIARLSFIPSAPNKIANKNESTLLFLIVL